MRGTAGKLSLLIGALLAALALAPSAATAATCNLPSQAEPDFINEALDVEGDILPGRTGSYVQIPFQVPAGTTAIRIRYSYDQPHDACNAPPPGTTSNTLDMGVYEPRDAGETVWGMDESRGWSGSSVRDIAIAENGFSDDATYNADRDALVRGRTTRAYRPGPIPSGEWAIELGVAFVSPDIVLPEDGIHYRVLVETTTDPDWNDDPYAPSGYSSAPVRTGPAWYAGDFHVHGEQEPGNATMTDTFAAAFGPVGDFLDFVTLVDHNNNVAHDNLGAYQAANPNNLIIPGVEETTYRGHHNNQVKGPQTDFRGVPILQPGDLTSPVPDAALTQVRGPVPPSQAFAEEVAAGNLSQINHPAIFRDAPSACRGCAWSYDSAETDYSKVEAIEIQTGPAGIPSGAPAGPNPFIADTLSFYESALDTGAHIAAVGSSDDHRGGTASGPFDSDVGHAATMVYADELSEQGIKDAIRADRTYVKFFGNDGPDISLQAVDPGIDTAIIGETLNAPEAELNAAVLGAEDTGRPGTWSLVLLKDGVPAETVPVAGNDFRHTFTATGPGRYALKVVRTMAAIEFTEVYSSPLWLEGGGASNDFRIVKVKRNKRKGTAELTVEVPTGGVLTTSGKKLEKKKRNPRGGGEVKITVDPKPGLSRKISRKGRATVQARVRYRPEGGDSRAKDKEIKLKQRRKR